MCPLSLGELSYNRCEWGFKSSLFWKATKFKAYDKVNQ